MKICFVLNMLSTGGAERVASRLCLNWSKDNDVAIILTSFSKTRDYNVGENVKVINLCEKKRISRIKVINKIRKNLKVLMPDVVISFLDTGHFYTSIACSGLKIKHICSERNDPYNVPTSKIQRAMRLFAFRMCDAIVFQTNGAKEFFNKKIQSKGIIIENPIMLDNNFQSVNDISNRIIAVGRLVPQKNYHLLINAFEIFSKKHCDYVLDIYGRGELEEELNNLIEKKNLTKKVNIKGFSNNILDEMLHSKIYAMSSLHEGLPNSLMEAVCLGIPSISTDANPGGPKQIIDGLSGSILVANDNVDAFVSGLEFIDSNYESFKKNAAIDAVKARERFSIDRICDEWLDLFYRITGKNNER